MMYDNNRDGILDEYTSKLAAECHIDTSTTNGKLHLHFIRGLVSDIVDRVAEDPDKFQWDDRSCPLCDAGIPRHQLSVLNSEDGAVIFQKVPVKTDD